MLGKLPVGCKEVPCFRVQGEDNCSSNGLTVAFEEDSLIFIKGEGGPSGRFRSV